MLDAQSESRYPELVHRDPLDVVGGRTRPQRVAHQVDTWSYCRWAAVLVDRWLRPGVHGRLRTSCHVLLVEPVLVLGGQTVARSSMADRDVGPQQ